MVHARVSGEHIHFALIYTNHHIFPVLTIKKLIKQYGEPTNPHKLATSAKPSVSNIHILFFSYVIRKVTVHVDVKVLNMHHQSQKSFVGIFVGIPQQQKG